MNGAVRLRLRALSLPCSSSARNRARMLPTLLLVHGYPDDHRVFLPADPRAGADSSRGGL